MNRKAAISLGALLLGFVLLVFILGRGSQSTFDLSQIDGIDPEHAAINIAQSEHSKQAVVLLNQLGNLVRDIGLIDRYDAAENADGRMVVHVEVEMIDVTSLIYARSQAFDTIGGILRAFASIADKDAGLITMMVNWSVGDSIQCGTGAGMGYLPMTAIDWNVASQVEIFLALDQEQYGDFPQDYGSVAYSPITASGMNITGDLDCRSAYELWE